MVYQGGGGGGVSIKRSDGWCRIFIPRPLFPHVCRLLLRILPYLNCCISCLCSPLRWKLATLAYPGPSVPAATTTKLHTGAAGQSNGEFDTVCPGAGHGSGILVGRFRFPHILSSVFRVVLFVTGMLPNRSTTVRSPTRATCGATAWRCGKCTRLASCHTVTWAGPRYVRNVE